MRNRYLLGAGVAVAMAFSWANAQAQLLGSGGPGAWYFGGEGGWSILENQSGTLTSTGVPVGAPPAGHAAQTQNFNDGFNVGARAGYEWGPWRFEEEFRFIENPLNSLTLGPSPFLPTGTSTAVSGARDAFAYMTNVIYDFNVGWALTPHLGAGVGAVTLHDSITARPFSLFGPGKAGAHLSSGSTIEFGYQAIAGVRYNINPSLAFDLDYRYLATSDPTFTSVVGPYSSGYSTHSLVASLSLRFGAPPPVAAPPMPPAPPMVARKVFLVFFDWDRDTITPEGMAIVQQAAAAFRAGGPVTIQVTGYTDRSGSPGYNQRLSERRANNVANAMVRLGVPRNQMAVSGRGENDNRVPTAPGVREPQNRRVEIVFP
jgi:OmpA-OmpF porin, OOP family